MKAGLISPVLSGGTSQVTTPPLAAFRAVMFATSSVVNRGASLPYSSLNFHTVHHDPARWLSMCHCTPSRNRP